MVFVATTLSDILAKRINQRNSSYAALYEHIFVPNIEKAGWGGDGGGGGEG